METDTNTDSSTPTENEEARSRFLESMGLGDIPSADSAPSAGFSSLSEPAPPAPEEPAEAPDEPSAEEDGVVLSSQSDEVSLPGSNPSAPTGARVVGVQVGDKEILNRIDSIESPEAGKTAPATEAAPSQETPPQLPSVASLEETSSQQENEDLVDETPPPLEPGPFTPEASAPSDEAAAEKVEDAAPTPESSVPQDLAPAQAQAPIEEAALSTPSPGFREVPLSTEETAPAAEKVEETEAPVAELPTMEEEEAAVESPEDSETETETSEPTLQLVCPKCEGELILYPEHLGVEGDCVWCQTKIVAAESGLDHQIRVFPVFQPDILREKSEKEASAEVAPSPEEVAQEDPTSPVSEKESAPAPIPTFEEPSALETDIDPAPATEESTPSVVEAPESETESSDAQGFAEAETPIEEPAAPANEAPTTESTPEPASEEETAFAAAESWSAAPATPSAELPEPETSFGAPAVEDADEPLALDFGTPADTSPMEAELPVEPEVEADPTSAPAGFADPMAGFGEPAPTPSPVEEEMPSTLPQGFGEELPTEPAFDKAKAEDLSPSAGFDDETAPTSFAALMTELPTPAGFGEGAIESFEMPEPEAEVTSTPGAPDFQDGFAATPAMESLPALEEEPAAMPEMPFEAAPDPSPEGATDWADSPAPWGSPAPTAESATPSPAPETEIPSGFDTAAEAPVEPVTLDGDEPSIFSNADASDSESPFSFASAEAEGPDDSPGATDFDQPKELSEDTPPLPEMPAPGSTDGGFSIPAAEEAEAFTFGAPVAATEEKASSELPAPEPVAESASIFEATTPPAPEEGEAPPSDALAAWGESNPLPSTAETPAPAQEEALPSTPKKSPPPLFPGAENTNAGQGGMFAPTGGTPVDSEASSSGSNVEKAPLADSKKKTRAKFLKGPGKPRKGLIVFLVILVGFVCGAAAASFLLPIEDYIVKAQTMMQEKFDPASLATMLSENEEDAVSAGAANLQASPPTAAPAELIPPAAPAPAPASSIPVSPAPVSPAPPAPAPPLSPAAHIPALPGS